MFAPWMAHFARTSDFTGDEADTACWDTDPAVVAWKAAQRPPLENAAEIFGWFVREVQRLVVGGGTAVGGGRGGSSHRAPVHWEEVFDRLQALSGAGAGGGVGGLVPETV
eukprot:SAG22_NODE_3638_length_1600_cov_1.269154_2_plen_110_part_00